MSKASVVIVILCYACGGDGQRPRDFFDENDLRQYVRDSHEVDDFDIIDPLPPGRRSKRSSLSESVLLTSRLNLSLFNEEFNLELFENPWLVFRGLKIKQVHGTKMQEKEFDGKRCHFHGRSKNHKDSVAVISTCSGVHGLITTGNIGVYIEPLREQHRSKLSSHLKKDLKELHIVYKQRLQDEFYGFSKAMNESIVSGVREKRYVEGLDFEYYVGPKFIEIKLCLDHMFVEKHFPDASEYAMALMNVASRRFVDSSLGFPVHLYVTSIIELKYPEPFAINETLLETFQSFREWLLDTRIYDDDDPDHWDHGILLSSYNFNRVYDRAIGRGSRLPPMCFPAGHRISCNVVMDLGLASGFVITHEIGHSLGLKHDDGVGVGCGTHFIMAHQQNERQSAFKWSTCSRKTLNKIWRGKAGCLDDIPHGISTEVSIVDVSPDVPSLSALCREYYIPLYPEYASRSEDLHGCEYETTCSSLYCKFHYGECFSIGVPPIEGTTCGPYRDRYCINEECVSNVTDISSLQSIDGHFSDWETSSCSRTCGGGIQVTRRTCSNPRSTFSGAFCDGQHVHYETCNNQPCRDGENMLEERENSCADIDIDLGFYTFLGDQVFTQPTSCLKACVNYTSYTWEYQESLYFLDGLKCWNDILKDSSNVERRCVAGKCVQFSCYGDEESEGTYDKCRICGGNGASCSPHYEFINSDDLQKQEILLLKNATSIFVLNHDCATESTRLALDFQLGDPVYSLQGNIFKVGFEYINNVKCAVNLTCTGPLTSDILLPLNHYSRTGTYPIRLFSVTYYFPKSIATFLWRPGPFGLCSVDCGNGIRTRTLKCVKVDHGEEHHVADGFCDARVKPVTTLACSIPCWSFIFSPCKSDQKGYVFTRVRSAECKIGDAVVDSSECNQATRPVNIQMPCSNNSEWIKYEWNVGPWSSCFNCTRTRNVICVEGPHEFPVPYAICNQTEKPAGSGICPILSCGVTTPEPELYRWNTGPWSGCSYECEQSRGVRCTSSDTQTIVSSNMCDPSLRPNERRKCGYCEEWMYQDWSECSVSCGSGVQTRRVFCISGVNSGCYSNRPSEAQDCHTPTCRTSVSTGIITAIFVIGAFLIVLCPIAVVYIKRKTKNQTIQSLRLFDYNVTEVSVNIGQVSTVSERIESTVPTFRDTEGFIRRIPIKDLPTCFLNLEDVETLDEELTMLIHQQEQTINIPGFSGTKVFQNDTNSRQDETVADPDNFSPLFVKDDRGRTAYIVTEGSCPSKAVTFWQLLWDENVSIIVDLTQRQDASSIQSPLPTSKQLSQCGDITFKLMRQNDRPEYSIISLEVAKGSDVRYVTVCIFSLWPENGIPDHPESFISFVKKLKSVNQGNCAPTLVHCNKDFKRPGSFMTIFTLTDQLKENQRVNVPEFVTKLVTNHRCMVPDEIHYIFVYEVLTATFLVPGVNVEPHTLISLELKGNMHRSKAIREYKALSYQHKFGKPTKSGEGCKHKNTTKNRYPNIIPQDPYLPLGKGADDEDIANYINATLIDSFWNADGIIMAQSPLPNTVGDFWSMIYSYKCAAIVSLNTSTNDTENAPCYWSEGTPEKYGKLTVECPRLQLTEKGSYVKRNMCIRKECDDMHLSVDHYELMAWPTTDHDLFGILNIIEVIQPLLKARQRIALHCLDGVSRCGIMAAVSMELGRVQEDGVVDLFQTACKLRRRNPRAISSQEEYDLCYMLLQAALKAWGK